MSTIDPRITKARSILVSDHPFFGCLAMRLIVQERADINTLATDSKFLFYCKAFLDKITETELIFCVAHEVLHCALGHMIRRGERRWDLWQAATDYVVNLMLHDAGFKVPAWAKYFDEKYRGLSVEQVYQLLEKEQPTEEQPQPNPQYELAPVANQRGEGSGEGENGDNECESSTGTAGDPSDSNSTEENSSSSQDGNANGEPGSSTPTNSAGTGSSGSSDGTGTQPGNEPLTPSYGDPGGCGEVLDATAPHDKPAQDAVAAEWQVYTRQAANIERRRGEGRLPGFIEEVIEILNTPQTDWREVLRRFVDPQTSTKDYSWARPNRRMMGLGYYVPGMISDGINHVAMLIDSSESVNTQWLSKFGAEVQTALDEGAIDKATLVFIDTIVQHAAEYEKGDIIDFTVKGRGGTRFAPAFEWVNKNAPDVSAAIYFTDLDCTDYGPEPPYPVLWAAYGPDPHQLNEYKKRVPFGEIVELRQ